MTAQLDTQKIASVGEAKHEIAPTPGWPTPLPLVTVLASQRLSHFSFTTNRLAAVASVGTRLGTNSRYK